MNTNQEIKSHLCPICGRTGDNRTIEHDKDYVVYRCYYCLVDFAQTSSYLDYHGEMYKMSGNVVRDSYKLDTLQSPEGHLAEPVRWYIRSLATDFLGKFPIKGKLLDVGCGVGTFAKMAEEQGFDVYAFDPAEEAVKYAREKFGLGNTFAGTIDDIPPDWKDFDVISILEVIEHVTAPRELANRIYSLLKPGGYFIISVPNRNRIGVKLWGKPEWDKPPHHLTGWSKQVLSFFLADLGFTDIHIRIDDLTRQSLSVFLPPRLNRKITGDEPQKVLQEGMNQEKTFVSNPLWKCVQKTGDGVAFLLGTLVGDISNRYLANSLIAVARKPGGISHH